MTEWELLVIALVERVRELEAELIAVRSVFRKNRDGVKASGKAKRGRPPTVVDPELLRLIRRTWERVRSYSGAARELTVATGEKWHPQQVKNLVRRSGW